MTDDTKSAQQAQFAQLPRVVQNAIVSADVEKEMRALATTHKLHIDQWERLENEVMMVLFGLNPIEQLEQNIQKNVGVTADVASALMTDIMRIVFAPIREELERELGHPEAKEEALSDVEKMREQVLAQDQAEGSRQKGEGGEIQTAAPAPTIQLGQQSAPAALLPKAGTPPPPPPTEKVIRMPASGEYKPGETSASRGDIADDPYREPPK